MTNDFLYLHYDIDNPIRHYNYLFRGVALELLYRLRVGEDSLLYLGRSHTGSISAFEAYFSVERYGILLAVLLQILVLVYRIRCISYTFGISKPFPELFSDMWSKRCYQYRKRR